MDIWKEQRKGKVTGSKFSDVITEPRTKKDKEAGILSQTAQSYLNQIIAEEFYDSAQFEQQTSLEDYYGYVNQSRPLEYGNTMESTAKNQYKSLFGLEIKEVGFVEYSGPIKELIGYVGCTPDGRIESKEGVFNVEIKCPWNPANHIRNILDPENGILKDYKAQIQGEMWITETDKTKVISFDGRMSNPKLWLVEHEVQRDDEFIDTILAPRVLNFVTQLKAIRNKFKQIS